MGLPEAFAAPYVETLADGSTIEFPLMTMDDWAACCSTLKANRRKEAELKLAANVKLSAQDREESLLRLDNELIPFAYAFSYRTETPAGIRSTLVKSLQASGKSEADAKAIVAKIAPVRQRQIAKCIADPPVLVKDNKPSGGDQKKEDETTNEAGDSTLPSSESSGESIPEA